MGRTLGLDLDLDLDLDLRLRCMTAVDARVLLNVGTEPNYPLTHASSRWGGATEFNLPLR